MTTVAANATNDVALGHLPPSNAQTIFIDGDFAAGLAALDEFSTLKTVALTYA